LPIESPEALVWLDYEHPLIMARVISRTFFRAVLRTELWAGNRERCRGETAKRLAQRKCADLVVIRLRRPSEAQRAIDILVALAADDMSTIQPTVRTVAPRGFGSLTHMLDQDRQANKRTHRRCDRLIIRM
jgi:hypothetical protein